MKPEQRSRSLLGVTRSKAKMYEYDVPKEHHIRIIQDPAKLFALAIGLLGDLAARTNSEDVNEAYLKELRENLQFSARFFDAYLQSRLNDEIDPYLWLLGAASYYLCDLPGSSLVLAKHLSEDCPDLDCLGLEDLLLWLLQDDLSTYFDGSEEPYGKYIDGISQGIIHYFKYGEGQDDFFEHTSNLRRIAYDIGTPRQLLFADVICAVVKRRYENSTWYCLPYYSDLTVDQWRYALQKETFVRELWPAQHLLGKQDVFRGKSAVVQMPASAGKTKATEIIIRSAFLSGRTSLAVIVAPFRALCHEIRNSLVEAFHNESVNIDELSDVLQADFEIEELLKRKQVLVVTPEKLIYVLRHTSELAENIDLLIYDEGHQFDSGTRGITYELLLTALKAMVPEGGQTVLISAVISNAESVNNWLNGGESEVVSGINLTPTLRTVAFTSWQKPLGQLDFVTQDNPDNEEFFVPRIIMQQQLQLRGREWKQRVFPKKTDGQSIALFLGLKTVHNGSVAVFCGRKSTASIMCKKVVDAYNRGLTFPKPIEFSNQEEVRRLQFLHECNLGADATVTQSASIGIFAHHGNTPHGIRLAVEHAMKEGHIKFVICTSTLAQGVNLPIRYLIVTSIYYGTDRIKVRDFHNLIGRAGRSGMHTEGSILFADPEIYDKRNAEKWRWKQFKELLDPEKSEPCASTLLSIFKPLRSDDKKSKIKMDAFSIVKTYVEEPEKLDKLPKKISTSKSLEGKYSEANIATQIAWKLNIISSIESYLMAHWDDSDLDPQENEITELAKGTLAYFLANEEQQDQIIELFKLLAQNIQQKVPDIPKRRVFGKTLYGVRTSIAIENWVTKHIEKLVASRDHDELLKTLWPILSENIQNRAFRKCDPPDVLKEIASGWIYGKTFYELLEILTAADARIIAGTQRWHFKLEHVVDICENAFAYDGTLVLGAIAEVIELILPEDNEDLISKLHEIQKRLKYGLPSTLSAIIYEIGFTDRVIAIEISNLLEGTLVSRGEIINEIKNNKNKLFSLLEKYPAYFLHVADNIV